LDEGSGAPRSSDLKDAKSLILAISWHLFPSSVIITFYDLIFVISTLPGKREYFEIHLHKKCTKLTPEELKAIALMSLVTLKKNSIRSWAQIYCWVKKTLKSKNSAIFYSLSVLFSLMGLFDGANKHRSHIREINYWLSLSVMTEIKWCKNAQLNAPLQRKRMSVTWDDFCFFRHIFKTILCPLSVSKDAKLFHSQNIYRPAFL